MKKSILLLLLLPTMLIASCSKDSDSNSENTQSKIKGTWTETSSKYEYYNASGTKVYEEPVSLGTINFDGNSTVTATYDGDVQKGNYTITKEGSFDFMTFNDGTETRKYNIVSLTNTNMSLTLETLNDFYYIGSTKKNAAKSILTSELIKK